MKASQMPQKDIENMEVPHPLICAYHNEILFSNSFRLVEEFSNT